jgi:hypothetical protein
MVPQVPYQLVIGFQGQLVGMEGLVRQVVEVEVEVEVEVDKILEMMM